MLHVREKLVLKKRYYTDVGVFGNLFQPWSFPESYLTLPFISPLYLTHLLKCTPALYTEP